MRLHKPMKKLQNKDYLQVLAYMFRFDAKAGFYLYPEIADIGDTQLWLNSGSTYEADVKPRPDVSVIKHGLRIPTEAKNYAEFALLMKDRETEFKQVFG